MKMTWVEDLPLSPMPEPGGGVPVDFAEWLKQFEERDASCVLRLWGLDGEYVDFTCRSVGGSIRVEPIAA